jgi:hypothetical protein
VATLEVWKRLRASNLECQCWEPVEHDHKAWAKFISSNLQCSVGLLLDKVRISFEQTIFVLKHYFASHNLYWRNILRIELYRMHSVLWNNQIYCNLKVIMLSTETNIVHIMSYAINYNNVIQNFLSDGSILSLADRYCLCLWRFVNLTEIHYACHSQICWTTKLFLMTPLSFKAQDIKKIRSYYSLQ